MDVYSSTLWHLRKEVALSHLSHQLLEADRRAPETWCAIGNCFSLKREHDTALKCFRRAVQLDEGFAYAYTLSGHECLAMDDYERALFFFRNAVRANGRHYTGW
ncbi:anaphase-promoting complex subunit cdc27 [Cladochytrium tenue]|nr:anaphase-promoting complex subunit cdc27 [Cladochytrium tenue]